MFLDFINSLIEDYFFLLFFLIYSSLKPSRLRILCYSFASIILSAFFTLSTSHNLVLNVGLLVGMQVLSFYSNKKAHYILNLLAFSTCAVASSILIELTTTSLLPDSLLQTYLGNLISNLICASSVTILFFFVRRRKNNNLIYTKVDQGEIGKPLVHCIPFVFGLSPALFPVIIPLRLFFQAFV